MARCDRIVARNAPYKKATHPKRGNVAVRCTKPWKKWHVPGGKWWRIKHEELIAKRLRVAAALTAKLVADIQERRAALGTGTVVESAS